MWLKIVISEDIVRRRRPFTRSRSSKVIDFGTNRKRVYTFLLVINNFSHILHDPFRRYGGLKAENRQFCPPQRHLTAPLSGNPEKFGMKLAIEKLEGVGYCTVKIA